MEGFAELSDLSEGLAVERSAVYQDYLVWLRKSGGTGVPVPGPLSTRFLPTRGSIPPAPSPQEHLTADLATRYPWIYPPADAFPFVISNVPTNLNVGQSLNLIQFAEVPRGQAGRVELFGNNASDFSAIQWSFVIRGRPVQPVTSLVLNYGAINNPVKLPGAGVLLVPGDDFIVQATNIGFIVVTSVQARVQGYLWRA